ncbi:hypothetical protein [Nitrosomonas sp. Is79A3]
MAQANGNEKAAKIESKVNCKPSNRPLKNYLRCRCGVKNKLKMLIYHA